MHEMAQHIDRMGDANTAHALTMAHPPTTLQPVYPWAARYNTWFLTKLTLKGAVFSFLFRSAYLNMVCSADCTARKLYLRPGAIETSVTDVDLLDHG